MADALVMTDNNTTGQGPWSGLEVQSNNTEKYQWSVHEMEKARSAKSGYTTHSEMYELHDAVALRPVEMGAGTTVHNMHQPAHELPATRLRA